MLTFSCLHEAKEEQEQSAEKDGSRNSSCLKVFICLLVHLTNIFCVTTHAKCGLDKKVFRDESDSTSGRSQPSWHLPMSQAAQDALAKHQSGQLRQQTHILRLGRPRSDAHRLGRWWGSSSWLVYGYPLAVISYDGERESPGLFLFLWGQGSQHGHSTLRTISNPIYFPKVPPPIITLGIRGTAYEFGRMMGGSGTNIQSSSWAKRKKRELV
jgi:hypothetical protein